MKYSVVIPARYGSTRLPGKALADIGGKPMVQRVYERALRCAAAEIRVATDDSRIEEALKPLGTKVLMTSADHPSGTDRLAEAADQLGLSDDDIVVNVQGDEPLIPPEVIDQVAQNLASNPDCACATLSEPIDSADDFFDPSVVKVVSDQQGQALYFSRAPVPWPRDQAETLLQERVLPETLDAQRHIGIYAYRAGLLRQFVSWNPSRIERIESLEQLRILAHGMKIHVAQACAEVPGGVDTPADLEKVRELFDA